MIYDRTQTDSDKAQDIRENKIKLDKNGNPKNSEPLTDDEKNYLERGTLNINTLNRIENKQKELKNLFNELGYWGIPIINKNWTLGDNFSLSDINRIVSNENLLVKAFFVYISTPDIPSSFLFYQDTNAIEKILYDLNVMINDVENNYRECGNFECGGD